MNLSFIDQAIVNMNEFLGGLLHNTMSVIANFIVNSPSETDQRPSGGNPADQCFCGRTL